MLNLLYKVMQPAHIYRGVTIRHCNGCYQALGKTLGSLLQAQALIDESCRALSNSLQGHRYLKQTEIIDNNQP